MSDTPDRVPAALPNDPEPVVEALEVAGALWNKGDHTEAIRWVRRAAEAAADVTNPQADQRGPVDYKRHLAREITLRALRRSVARAQGQEG